MIGDAAYVTLGFACVAFILCVACVLPKIPHRVAVLHPMPAGVSVQATRTLQLGQRVKRGDLSPHPVLGNIGELTTEQVISSFRSIKST